MTEKDFLGLPPECDELCEFRICLHKGYNKGSYAVGRGYTSYYSKPIYCCMHRLNHGCGDNRKYISAKKLAAWLESQDIVNAKPKQFKQYAQKMWLVLDAIISDRVKLIKEG